MSKAPTEQTDPTVINLRDRMLMKRKKAPELVLDLPDTAVAPIAPAAATYVIPAGKPKLVLALGSGQTGKSLLLRWMAERAVDAKRPLFLGTLAPNRTLKHYFTDAQHPDGNSTSAGAAFLEAFLDSVADSNASAVLDFPGDDTALPHLLDQGANPVDVMAQAGVEVVALHMMGPRVEDLTTMVQLAAKGFKPQATALILNTGITSDPTLPAEAEFEDITSHSAFQSTVAAGAVPIWMPRLYSSRTIETYRMRFARARKLGELGPSDVSRTHHWLAAMEDAFKPIASWLP
jgi:hypothetical protein